MRREVGQAPVGEDDVERDDREIQKRPVLDLHADRDPAGEHPPASGDRDRVAPAKDHVR